MKKNFILSAMLFSILALSFVFVGCDTGGGGGDTYTYYADGLITSDWNLYFGSSLNPNDLIDQSYTTAEVNSFFSSLEALAFYRGYGRTEAQLRTVLTGFGIDGNDINAIINKLKQQEWVLWAKTPATESFDYADLIGIRKE